MIHPEVILVGAAAAAIAVYIGRAYLRWIRPGTVSDDIRADARRALSDTRRLLR